jgi:MFS family permease
MQLFVGLLIDRYGTRRLLNLATLCCVLGSVLFAITPYLWVAELGRFIVGFGSAFAFVGMLKLATIWLPKRYFGLFAGIATAFGMIGAITGDIALTHIVETFGWQHAIYYSAAFGVLLALLIGLFVRDENAHNTAQGIVVNTANMREALQGLLQIIKSKQMWVIGAIGGLLYIPTSAFAELWGIPYLKQAHDLNATQAAVAVSMIFWGWAVGSPLAGWLSDILGRRTLPLSIKPLFATLLILAVLYLPALSFEEINILLFMFGLFSAAQVIVFAAGKESNPSQLSATACAFVNFVVMISGVIFQPFIGLVLDYLWHGQRINGVQQFSVHEFQIALLVLPIGLTLGALLANFALRETYLKTAAEKPYPQAQQA